MQNTEGEVGDVRAYLEATAAAFREAQSGRRPEAVLEAADAGPSFEDDLVRAKFRVRDGRDMNALGIIVKCPDETPVPTAVSPADLADRVAERLRPIRYDMSKGAVRRVAYETVWLDELLPGADPKGA